MFPFFSSNKEPSDPVRAVRSMMEGHFRKMQTVYIIQCTFDSYSGQQGQYCCIYIGISREFDNY